MSDQVNTVANQVDQLDISPDGEGHDEPASDDEAPNDETAKRTFHLVVQNETGLPIAVRVPRCRVTTDYETNFMLCTIDVCMARASIQPQRVRPLDQSRGRLPWIRAAFDHGVHGIVFPHRRYARSKALLAAQEMGLGVL